MHLSIDRSGRAFIRAEKDARLLLEWTTTASPPLMAGCEAADAPAVGPTREPSMYYAILAYHAEGVVESWSKEEDATLMDDLLKINDRLVREKHLGPAARLGPTRGAKTVRGSGDGMVMDGPFAETKEELLGFYVVDYPSIDEAIAAAQELRRANPTAIYEIRPVMLYLPGADLEEGKER
jgi:hypothetical protein